MNWMTWAILAAVFAGATATLAKIGVSGVDSHLATAIRTVVVLVFSSIFAYCVVPTGAMGAVTRKTLVFLVLSGIATALSWICYYRALQLGDVAKVAAVDKLGVVFAILFAMIFLGERLSWLQSTGVVFIILGVMLVAMTGRTA